MKKIYATILLSVMMFIAIQPVIAVHFCSRKLYSFNLIDNADACCDTASHAAEKQSCCATTGREMHANVNNCDAFDGSSCCDTHTIQVQTDEFQSELNQISFSQIVRAFDIPWLTLENLFKQYDPESKAPLLSEAFPPDGLFLRDVSINTFVCIYRI